MIRIRKSEERGHFNHGWLDSYHTFSFGDYHDPEFMGFRSLRVINEDRVAPGQGFHPHPHRNMEIVTYIISGALEHRDNLGGHAILRPGEIQRITAGKGIIHSELNPSSTEAVHLLQIWILPEANGLAPGYEQLSIPNTSDENPLVLIASPNPTSGAVKIHQDASIYAGKLESGGNITHAIMNGRALWLQLISGELDIQGQRLHSGDALFVESETQISIQSIKDAHFLLFDLQ